MLLLVLGGSAAARPAQLRLQLVARGFVEPVYVTAPRAEPARLYVVERPGRVRVLESGRLLARPFLDLRRLVSLGAEQGLLSMAFHPRYPRTPLVYVNYTDRAGDTRVVEYRVRGGRAVPATARLLLTVDQPYANHNGGQLQFGPDGKLYVGMGDGGSGGDPDNNGQTPSSRLAKLLRTSLPRVRWEVAGYGLRNPWRFSFDRATGALYIGDVGQSNLEEIDYRPRGAPPANFGWARYEGNRPYKSVRLNPPEPLVFPIAEYSRDSGCSVTGGYVYRGRAVPSARGRYFYGDYCTGFLWSLRVEGGKAVDVRREPFTVVGLSSFGEDSRGELYLVACGSNCPYLGADGGPPTGSIYRLAG